MSAYERTYPGKTSVIETHNRFAAFFDLARGRQLEARMRSWPTPSIVRLEGTWLADLDLPYFFWPFPRRMAGERIAELVDAPARRLPWCCTVVMLHERGSSGFHRSTSVCERSLQAA